MDFERILLKKLEASKFDTDVLDEYEKEFDQKLIYESCGMECNLLTFDEVKTILKNISNK